MENWDRRFLLAGIAYAIIGLSLGLFMAASHIHLQSITHAHTLLVGFLLSLIYAIIHKLWLPSPRLLLAKLQFACHHTGAVVMVISLFLLYQALIPESVLEPFLAISSILVLIGMVLMFAMVLVAKPDAQMQVQS